LKTRFSPVRILCSLLAVLMLVAVACGSSDETAPAASKAAQEVSTATQIPAPQPTAAPQATTAAALVTSTPACGNVGGTLLEAEGHEWQNLDPPTYISHTDRRVNRIFYDTLIDIDAENKIIPRLAESWELQPNGKDYVFKVRKDVTFHDGTAFDAQAAIDHFNRVYSIEGGTVTGEIPSFDGDVELIGPHTFKMVLTEASAPFLISMYDIPGTIESPTAVAALGSLALNPVGTGPYSFVSNTPSIEVVGERNPDYWMTGLPCFDSIKMLFIPDASARLAALRTGQIHIANELPLSSWAQLQTMEEVNAQQFGNGSRLRYIEFNHESPLGQLENFRRAVLLAVDRESFYAAHSFGTGKIGYQPVYPDMPWYNADLKYDRDLPEARKLLEATGLSPDELKFNWYLSSSQDEAGLTVIQSNLAEVGINFDIVRVDGGTNSQLRRDSEQTATLGGWTRRPDPDPYFSSMVHSQSGWNKQSARLSDPEVDRLIDLSRSTIDDEARRAVFKEIGHYMFDTGHHITLMYEGAIVGLAPGIKGYQLVPDGITRYGQFPYWLE